jgi:uncharacterized iron-regulated membrane protein
MKMKIKGMIIGLVAMVTLLAIPMTSEAGVIVAIQRRQRVVVVNQIRVQKVVQVQQVVAVQALAVFQPVQAVSFVPLVQVQPVYGQYASPIRSERVIEKVGPDGRVIERIIER